MTRRILITDDYPRAAEMLARRLGRFDYEIRLATDAFEAIAIAEKFIPDVLLIDIRLPGMNGYETAKHIRSQLWSRGSVLIAMSGDWDDECERLSREAGFDAHLVKPVAVKDIVDLIEELSLAIS